MSSRFLFLTGEVSVSREDLEREGEKEKQRERKRERGLGRRDHVNKYVRSTKS